VLWGLLDNVIFRIGSTKGVFGRLRLLCLLKLDLESAAWLLFCGQAFPMQSLLTELDFNLSFAAVSDQFYARAHIVVVVAIA